ncbi:DUF2437 domain-containing protein [Agromyces sp. CFH 90414]|uniref:DUF2437 domain-containing protein n=1 Tax=Agromyces agglutinans TaxID=2662258 RepID=A0A6I2FCG6_9MICO|nr:DUF2437 domain-containing protein [Agromyces agglutinans]
MTRLEGIKVARFSHGESISFGIVDEEAVSLGKRLIHDV